MKTYTCGSGMRKSGNPYTKYEGGGRRPAPSYDDSIRATGPRDAVMLCAEARPPRVVKKIEFRILPLPGTVLMHEGQRYVVIGSDLHRRKDGEVVPIKCWSGLRSGTLNRRCQLHHAPGKAVAGKARKRVAAHIRKHGRRKKS
jgi:hypothetical protein